MRESPWQPGELATWDLRFWKRVMFDVACWGFDGAHIPEGYASFSMWCPSRGRTQQVGAHRVAYETLVGPIPIGLVVDHLCRNRGCLYPRHMELVTIGVNNLRGEGIPARNLRKTHCPRGHPYEGDNLLITPKGFRRCRTCARIKMREKNARLALSYTPEQLVRRERQLRAYDGKRLPD